MIRELDLFTGVPSKDCFLGNVAKLAARLARPVTSSAGCRCDARFYFDVGRLNGLLRDCLRAFLASIRSVE